jgi:hypothetical protein
MPQRYCTWNLLHLSGSLSHLQVVANPGHITIPPLIHFCTKVFGFTYEFKVSIVQLTSKTIYMRLTILFLLICFHAHSQVNRSALELARENTEDFLTTKIFRNQTYRPITFSTLEPYKNYDPDISWVLEHKCEVLNTTRRFGKDTSTYTTYKFVFYLDRKLKVFRAESFQGNLLTEDEKPAVMAKREEKQVTGY